MKEYIMRPNRVRRGFAMPKRLTDRAWVAGFLDGEGYICARKRRDHKSIEIEVRISNTVEAPILHLQELFGGRIQYFPNPPSNGSSPYWRWTGSANVSRVLLKATIPYLHIKREQAELALKLLNMKDFRWTEERYNKELELLEGMRNLDSRKAISQGGAKLKFS